MEKLHIETTNFEGRRIICTESQWYDHIVENKNHNYMDGAESEVIDALKNPHNNYRCHDRYYKNRRVYYGYREEWEEFTKVIVEFENEDCNGEGKVITAYAVDTKSPSELPELGK